MSTEAIAFYISNLTNTGAFAFYYDFNHWADSPSNHVLTTGSGIYTTRTRYSGAVEGDFNSFTGAVSGSGAFSNNYIKVANVGAQEDGSAWPPAPDAAPGCKPAEINRELTTSGAKQFTFLFSQEKVDGSCGTIFSNSSSLSPVAGEVIASGWEFGINNANRLYFKFQDVSSEAAVQNNILTLEDTPAAKNYYGIVLQGDNLSLGRYLPESRTWNVASRSINPGFINPTNDWYIGSGEYNYSGFMDKFAYFNEAISFSDLSNIIDASFQSLETGLGFTGEWLSGNLTGNQPYPTGETGVIGQTGVASGYLVTTGSGLYATGGALRGNVTADQIYYEAFGGFTGSGSGCVPEGQFYSGKFSQTSLTNVITGFETGFSGCIISGSGLVYTVTGITGIISTGTGYSGMFGPSGFNTIFSGANYLSGELINSYLKNTATYLGQRTEGYNVNPDSDPGLTGDFVEYVANIDYTELERVAGYSFSPLAGETAYFVGNKARSTAGEVVTFSNGVFQTTGFVEYGTPECLDPNDPGRKPVIISSGNYVLSGTTLYPVSEYYAENDLVIYDSGQEGIQQRLDIYATSAYASAPFSEITPHNTQVFFNGQKIYSGIDYVDDGGFTPIGPITGITGSYLSVPAFSGISVTEYTGVNLYDLTGSLNDKGELGFSGDNFVAYVNGVRAWFQQDFVTYCTGVSLLTTGKNALELPHENIYNISTTNNFF